MLSHLPASNGQSVSLRRIRQAAICSAALAAVLGASSAHATGTLAGTDITNIASASYETGGTTVNIDSNPVVIRVDELLDVTTVGTDPGDVQTTNGATNVVSTFRVTNTGNGPEAFRLTPNVANGGDDFDPTLSQVILDTNGNGVYDPGVDTVYVAGSNDPLLQPDQGVTVFVLTNIPASQVNGDRAQVSLTAAAVTGTGAPGTTFAGQGQGGGNAVVGTTGADADGSGFVRVQSASIALVKSATVADPFGGTTSVPGSIITYTLVATISGTGSLNNIAINDPIPAGSTYVAGSMTLQAAALTDVADADAGNFNGTRINVGLGNVAAGQTRTVTFRVTVQ
jgi:uncharacterized repeat protein (TIGR01451 family)